MNDNGFPITSIDSTLIGIDSFWDQIMRIRKNSPKNFKGVIRRTLIGRKITTNYEQGTTYTFEGIYWDKNPKTTWVTKDNQEMSFGQHFKRKYGIEIKDMKQPLIYGSHECSSFPILLVPELCFATCK